MKGLGFLTLVAMMMLASWACSPGKPAATDYKEKLRAGAGAAQPATQTGTGNATGNTPAAGTPATGGTAPAAPAGNAQNGLSILMTSCENAGCHKDSAPPLTKTSKIDMTTGAKAAHRGVAPLFTEENIRDLNAALAGR